MSRKLLIFMGVIFFISPVFFLPDSLDKLDVQKNGKIVTVKVTALPNDCIGSRRTHLFFKFEYQGKIYSHEISTALCEVARTGDLIHMVHSDKYKDIFLFPGGISDWISTILLSVAGLIIIIINWKRP